MKKKLKSAELKLKSRAEQTEKSVKMGEMLIFLVGFSEFFFAELRAYVRTKPVLVFSINQNPVAKKKERLPNCNLMQQQQQQQTTVLIATLLQGK